jgi:hypothetical protein
MKAGSPRATISAKYLPLLDAFRAKSDVRYYLDGIRIEPHETEDAYLVATNGLQLVVVHDAEAVVDETMNQLRPDWLPKHVVAKAA